jgi:hypothetical protein
MRVLLLFSRLMVMGILVLDPVSAFSPSNLSASSRLVLSTTSQDSLSQDQSQQSQKVATSARVVFVAGSAPSGYGATSPLPNPTWIQVAHQLAKRLPHFVQVNDDADNESQSTSVVETCVIDLSDATSTTTGTTTLPFDTNVVVVLGVTTPSEQAALDRLLLQDNSNPKKSRRPNAVLCDPTCAPKILEQRYAGNYHVSSSSSSNLVSSWQSLYTKLAPWSTLASHQRLLQKADTLLARKSSEDYLFAVLFTLHSLVMPIDVVKSDINPSWEKGVVRNVQEFKSMVDCCGPQIQAALTDPQSKGAIDLLNDLDLRDQVGSYRVIVSNETPQLEDFTLCILQQNNCFQCDSPILQQPRVPLLQTWRGQPLDHAGARQILLGHLEHSESLNGGSYPWSWKIVVGANPAYDAFPMQHQIFYPSGDRGGSAGENNNNVRQDKKKTGSSSMWYDPVFCVETLDGGLVWCKRHYRCTPRQHWSESKGTTTPGAWTLTTLDNGMVSEEHWTTVDAADDLSWSVLHYSGAARRAGQSYVGALLCTSDGQWPKSVQPGTSEWNRIQKAFRNCDLELWELFGGSHEQSYMWSSKFTDWAETHPPPLDRIGDMSITTWRKRMRQLDDK